MVFTLQKYIHTENIFLIKDFSSRASLRRVGSCIFIYKLMALWSLSLPYLHHKKSAQVVSPSKVIRVYEDQAQSSREVSSEAWVHLAQGLDFFLMAS